jgi:hypothetical protein
MWATVEVNDDEYSIHIPHLRYTSAVEDVQQTNPGHVGRFSAG